MIFSWLKQRRRQRILAEPFPIQWLNYFRDNLLWYPLLDESNRIRLRRDVQVFVAEKNWEGCGGLQMTEEIKVTIAAQACLLVLELEEGLFDRVLSVLVYPGGYHSREAHLHEGWLIEEENDLLGQAHYRGPVILSWKDVLADSRHWGGGKNLVWHEFAHQLDALDREWNGTPPLSSVQQCRKWRDVMTAEYERLIADAEAGRKHFREAACLGRVAAAYDGGRSRLRIAHEHFARHPRASDATPRGDRMQQSPARNPRLDQ